MKHKSRILSLFCLLALLLSSCDALPFLRGPTPTNTRVPTWTRIPTRTPTTTPTKVVRPTKTVTPTPSITPTRFPTHTPISIGNEPQPVITDTTGITATLGISYLEIKNSLEPFGFIFPEGIPLTTTLIYEASYPAVPVELVMSGSPEALSEIEMSFNYVRGDEERMNNAIGTMQRLLAILQPGWDEASSWLLEAFQEGLTSSDDEYDRSRQRNGMFISLEMDRLSGSVVLTVGGSP
jgi:hypothetical protein